MAKLGTKAIKRELVDDCVRKTGYKNQALGKILEKEFNKLKVQTLVILKNHIKR